MPSTFPIDIGVTAHFGRRLSRNGPKTATASIKDGKEGEPLSRIKVGEDYERARKVRGDFLPENSTSTDGGLADRIFLLLHMFAFLLFVAIYCFFIV